ncbi:SEC10/PgrA surface exclusion domain-containing protein [Limosilactobacillus reuteri]|uniref:LPXTG-motif cell wall anchor domain protein n=1 Tax=Limosilactobacillus reuteri subsp. rodentium (strain DSM 17509 / CIP 109821 / 100-23) TaxID=349123 RepID=B3XL71_LIMR1|nr:SEC10/PgrA surface exclusion domain-containing protein [Limosilactobacillus reuteri]EDX43083.1 LPXTG-motif cell wall anchor domain protein [Limosilactobacillus reuteri subsp. rodentium]MCC4475214.1 SEC10/PgrA surface exclusion domain-containing protein [Limosilactobacillus reuteri]
MNRKNVQKTALTTSAVLAGMALGVSVNQNGVHADTTTNATNATNASDQQLANLKSQQAANESAVASSNAATMSAAMTSANSQITDLNNQIKARQASDAAAQQNKIDQVNKDAQAATIAENGAYSSAVAKQKAVNAAELKDAQTKTTAEQQKSINQENTDFKNKSNSLNTEHNQNLKQIGNNYQDQSQEINQKIADAKKADQQHYNQVIENATKQVDNQINNATTAVNQAQKTVNDDQTDIKNKQSANDQAQSAAKAATDTLNSDQTALSAAKKQAQDAILPRFPQYVDISQDYINGLPQVHDQQSADALEAKDPEHSNFFRNSYQSDLYAANEPIDVTNLTDDQLLQINLYSTRLINQVREQFNQPALTLNSEGIENAQRIANQAGKERLTGHSAELLQGAGENIMGFDTDENKNVPGFANNSSENFSFTQNGAIVIHEINCIKTMDDLQALVFYSVMDMLFADNTGNNADGHARNFLFNKGQMALGIEVFQNQTVSNQKEIYLRWIFNSENKFAPNNNIKLNKNNSLEETKENKTISREIILKTPNGEQHKTQTTTITRKILKDKNSGKIIKSIWYGKLPTYNAPNISGLVLINPSAGKEISFNSLNPDSNIEPVTFVYQKNNNETDSYKFKLNIQYLLPNGEKVATSKVIITNYRFKQKNGYSDFDGKNSKIDITGIPAGLITTPERIKSDDPSFLEFSTSVKTTKNLIKEYFPGYHLSSYQISPILYYVYNSSITPINGTNVDTRTISFKLLPDTQHININYQTASGQVIAVDHLVGKPGDTTAVTLHIPDGYELADNNQPTSFTYQFKSNQPDILISVKGGNGKDQATVSKPENAAKKLQDQIRQLTAKIDSDIQIVTDAQNKSKATATDLKSAQAKLASDSDSLSQAQAKLDDLKANRNKAIKEIAGEPTESPIIKKLQNQLTDLENDRNKAIENENAQYEAKVSDLKANHEAKLKDIATQPANLADLQSQLQAKLDALKANHDAKLKQINDDANAKIATIKSQKVNDPEIDKLQAQIDQIKSDLTEKQQELDSQYQALKAKDQAEFNALAEKLKNSSSETAKGNNDHYTTDDGSATVKLPDKKNDSDKSESDNKDTNNNGKDSSVKHNDKTNGESTNTHKDVTNPTTDKNSNPTNLPEKNNESEGSVTKDKGNGVSDLNNPTSTADQNKPESDDKDVTNVNNATAELFEKGENNVNSHNGNTVRELNNSVSRGISTPTTAATSTSHDNASAVDASTNAPTMREEVKQQAKLPQTGNSNSLALLALGAIASMFGFGLITKKRY